MLQKSRELILSLVAIVFITITYLLVTFIFQASPDPGSFFGHALGIIGFLLMVMTETLYTLRKRSHSARWGRMTDWLEFHIFTGLVGPYMVILHSAWRFNGLAGVLTLLTIVIVISGFIGRYIYTAVPRTPNGVEITVEELENQVAQVEDEMTSLDPSVLPGPVLQAAVPGFPEGGITLGEWRTLKSLDNAPKALAHQLSYLRKKRDRIRRQINSLNTTRRMLSIWHLIHIPLGLTLFAMAIIHVIAAVYYAVLMR